MFKKSKGTAEREPVVGLVGALGGNPRITLGADKNDDTQGFVTAMREMNGVLHVAQRDTNRSSAIDGRTTRHPGYEISQTRRTKSALVG